ncbi:MAG: dockerin type I domain-containing protein [Lacipirellulaceae bacterium]
MNYVVNTSSRVALALGLALSCVSASAQNTSNAAILQVYELKWADYEDRLADAFVAGYGRLWLPPPAKAETGGLSVGYDVFDRFDLGSPRSETLYGTEKGLKTLINNAHRAGMTVHTDFIPNHNGFADLATVDTRGTATTADDVTFQQGGGYPGFALQLPGAVDGDFNGAFESGEENFRLAGLIDIDQTTNHQFIRHPTTAGNPLNIPAGTAGAFGRSAQNVPNESNARLYPDQGLGGTTVFDARNNQNVTLYDFNTTTPLSGDPVTENALGLIMRNARWMIQEVGVDGFRIDAARHFPRWVLNYFDQAVFRAEKDTYLDGSPKHPFTFLETGYDTPANLQPYIRKDINNADLGQVGGNRDALDFNLFGAIKANLSSNGLVNDWRNVKNASIDANDGFANNGSQGVAFAQSHDEGPAHLNSVAHAYLLMRPGEAIVYMNAKQFGEGRSFPQNGRNDALGGIYGDAITTLVNLRNSHGRGNYLDRTPGGSEKELLIYEREKSALVVLNNRGDSGFDSRTVQTAFAPGTPLVELTGNAEDAFIDPNGDLPSVLIVKPDGTVDLRAPRNKSTTTGGVVNDHRSGYLVYGVSGPQGQMRITDASGATITSVIAGSTPVPGQGAPNGQSDDFVNGRTRLDSLPIVTQNTFKVRIETNAVNLLGSIRDTHADGDLAQLMVNGGIDVNGNNVVDNVTPGTVSYGFEAFSGINQPGYGSATGNGLYEQTIDATQLAEGRHYITGRVFRHRDAATGGDGGPAVFTDFREVVYVDRFKPVSAVVSFDPFASDPGNPNNRDLIVRSTDATASAVHVFIDLPATTSEASIIAQAQAGQNRMGSYDRDQFIFGYTNITEGNHVVTVVTIEPSGNTNVQRLAGQYTVTNRGRGIGDTNANNQFEVADISGANGFESVLYSQNSVFRATADATADGLVDTRDLIALGPLLVSGAASQAVLNEYSAALLRRADLNQDSAVNEADLAALYANLGSSNWRFDVNLDGATNAADAQLLVTSLVRTVAGDMNLDGVVNAADYTLWRDAEGTAALAADTDFDGDVDTADYGVWASAYGFARGAYGAGVSTAVPEPTALAIGLIATLATVRRRPD